ncbi:hypothetical protein ACLOJK_033803 [Asimina triloba]
MEMEVEGKEEEEMLLQMQQLRFKASELFLREEWHDCIDAYSHFISLSQPFLSAAQSQPHHDEQQQDKLKKWLCLALSNRAEARRRLRHLSAALLDCNHAIQIDATHYKSLLFKGTILLDLDRYSAASDCFKRGLQLHTSDALQGLLDRCKKLDFQSRTGAFDLSDWVLNGFRGKSPELAEFVGPVEIKRSEDGSGGRQRGLFATKDLEAGALLVMTKPVAIGRAILPDSGDDCRESARIIMWKDFVAKVLEAAGRSRKTLQLIYALSTGEDEQGLRVPDLNLFRPETKESCFGEEKEGEEEIPDMGRILKILDVNSTTEDGTSATVLGKKDSSLYGVGLWILPSFINHSCNPNARRLHIGDHMAVHTSRDVKAGEEITFAYFDVLLPLKKRRELSRAWGFCCSCKRCRFEDEFRYGEELKEIEMRVENELLGDRGRGEIVVGLEQSMKRWMVKGKERGFLRASFWSAFSATFKCQREMRRWGRRIPPPATAAECAVEAVGGDERVVSLVVDAWKKGGVSMDMEDLVMKLGRGIYGKVIRKKAMRALLEQSLLQQQ